MAKKATASGGAPAAPAVPAAATKPLKFGQHHYVPILKTKRGERWALRHLSQAARAKVTPLMEVHAHGTLGHDAHCDSVCEDMAAEWGTAAPLFVDVAWISGPSGSPSSVACAMQSARANGLMAIPVARTNYNAATLAAIRTAATQDGRGYMLRVHTSDLDNPAGITATVAAVGLPRSDVHLMLDYRGHAMSLSADVPRVPSVAQWATFTAASGVAPQSLSTLDPAGNRLYPLNAWTNVARRCFTSWQNGCQGGLPRPPAFSDFATRYHGRPATGGRPSVELRYTTAGHWLVWIGGKVSAGASPQMRNVCANLVGRAEYSGLAFSAGDGRIHATAQPAAAGPGGAGDWVKWGISHHLEYAAQQV